MQTLTIQLQDRSYPVHVGREILNSQLSALNCQLQDGVVVTDENVYPLYKDRIDAICGPERVAIMAAGESAKSPESLFALWSYFANQGLKRGGCVVAVGGGVIGDLTGFAAATYMRGVPFVQVPTTLLAQVDASVGGKSAVNLPEGKNLAGNFYQPRAVIADIAFLDTLPEREVKTGMGEIVKHVMLGGTRLLELLRNSSLASCFEEIVLENIKMKAIYVESDEREDGQSAAGKNRTFLNFGHTFGHALETHTQYARYSHGEAVAIGMTMAVRAGIALGVTAPETREVLAELLKLHGLPDQTEIPAIEFLPLMLADKKNRDGEINLVLLEAIGKPVTHKVSLAELRKIFG